MVQVQSGVGTFRVRCADARDVFLIGDFNNWSTTATPMRRVRGDEWEAQVLLPPGPHRHRYFVWRQGRGPAVLRDEAESALAPDQHGRGETCRAG